MKSEILNKHQKKDIKFHLSFELTIGILIFLLVVLLYLYFYYYFFGGKSKSYISRGKVISFLFLGLDNDKTAPRTDAILIGVYNTSSKRIGVIAIPRDLIVYVHSELGKKGEKINTIYPKYGKRRMIDEIENLLGIKIQYYGIINIDNFIKIVDLLGGVEVFVEKPMYYIDKSAGLYINISKGIVKCDGLKAMKYIRYRSDERGDLKRIERFIEFGLSLLNSRGSIKNFITDVKILKLILKFLDTNINVSDAVNLIRSFSEADYKNIEILRIGGRFIEESNTSFIEADETKIKENVKNFLKELAIKRGDYTPDQIKVQVLNGSGKSGIAKLVRDKLIRNGFNVVEFGNADSDNYQNTIILDRTGKISKSLKVASILNCKNVYIKINPFIMVDVTVIIGRDYNSILK